MKILLDEQLRILDPKGRGSLVWAFFEMDDQEILFLEERDSISIDKLRKLLKIWNKRFGNNV